MKILGFNLDYRRVLFYKEIEANNKKTKGSKSLISSDTKKIANIFANKNIDVVNVKFRHWWYSWWSTYPVLIFIIPLIFIPIWQKRKRLAFAKMAKLLSEGYSVSQDAISQNIVVQMAGLPLHPVKGEIKHQKGYDFDQLRKDYWFKYKFGKMTDVEKAAFKKYVDKFFKENEIMGLTRSGKRIIKGVK